MSLPDTNNLQVFIIEDDEHIAAIFKMAFERAGYDPLVIPNGRAAMECLLKMTPRLIVLDLHLPFVSGHEILAYVEATERLTEITIVIVSADHSEIERLKQEGYQGLLKPVGFRQMYNFAMQLHATGMGNPEI